MLGRGRHGLLRYVVEVRGAYDLVGFEQLTNAIVQGVPGLESCRFDLIVTNYIVTLIRILGERRFHEIEVRNEAFDVFTQFKLREVGVTEAEIVRLAAHGGEVVGGATERGASVTDHG